MNRRNLYREEAIPLVMLDPETKRYTINNEALEMISQLPSPIGVNIIFKTLGRWSCRHVQNRKIISPKPNDTRSL